MRAPRIARLDCGCVVAKFWCMHCSEQQLTKSRLEHATWRLSAAAAKMKSTLLLMGQRYAGEKPDSRSVGPFTPFAEKWNGRLAMLGFSGVCCNRHHAQATEPINIESWLLIPELSEPPQRSLLTNMCPSDLARV